MGRHRAHLPGRSSMPRGTLAPKACGDAVWISRYAAVIDAPCAQLHFWALFSDGFGDAMEAKTEEKGGNGVALLRSASRCNAKISAEKNGLLIAAAARPA